MKLKKQLPVIILMMITTLHLSATDIKPGDPGANSSKKATIITSYPSKSIAKDSITVALKKLGYKIESSHKLKIEGYKPVNNASSRCSCDSTVNCSNISSKQKGCSCQSKKSILGLLTRSNREKTPAITAEIKSSKKQIVVYLSSKIRRKKVEPLTDLESLSKNLRTREVVFE